MLNFRNRIFYSVATHLSFTKAAEELFITQPAVTKNIKELESELDISLFDRIKGKVFLTDAGQIFLDYVKQQLEAEERLIYELSVLKDAYTGHLHLGASTTIGQYILPAILAKFNKEYPEIKISLLNDNTQRIEAALANKEIEVGLVEGKSKNSHLSYAPFREDEIVAIAHSSQPLSENDEISIEQFKKIPLVVREVGSGSLEVITERLSECGISYRDLNVKVHLGSTESIKSYLTDSNSLGLISINAVAKEIANGEFKVIDINGLDIVRTFNFVHRHGKLSGLGELFMQYAQKAITNGYRV